MLKPLLLPQLVEERRQRESLFEGDINDQPCDIQDNNSSTQSPITPTFSTRGHVRYSSSVSSLDAFATPPVEVPSSPSFSGKLGGKTSLPDVEEEPERHEHFETFDDRYDVYDWSCKLADAKTRVIRRLTVSRQGDDTAYNQYEDGMSKSSVQMSAFPETDYDLNDGFVNDNPAPFNVPNSRKRAHSDSPFANIADRLSTRFPGFGRKWTGRKDSNPLSLIITSMNDSRGQSRAPSTRSSSLSNSVHQPLGISFSHGESQQMSPTPAQSDFALDSYRQSDDSPRDEDHEHDRAGATTPLLPPLMMGKSNTVDEDIPVQSPLQSPSIADTFDTARSRIISPLVSQSHTPSLLPSPPLSTKPSISSMRPVYPLSHTAHPSQLLGPGSPSIENPNLNPIPITIAQEDDKWSNILGHANFTISPVPYMPETADLQSCKVLREAWEQARAGFLRHLVRTGEHYGDRSEIYRKTEEKWKEIDEEWRTNNESLIARTSEEVGMDEEMVLKMLQQGTSGGLGEEAEMIKIPKLNDKGLGGGKFLELGDGDIVGPMHRDEGMNGNIPRSPSRKERFKKFFTELVGRD